MSTRSRSLRATVGAATVAGLGLLLATPAAAHVSPDKSEVAAGSFTSVKLLVPHGCDGSPTTKIEVQVPESIAEASPYVVPGWKAETTKVELAKPVSDGDGGEITERDATVVWTAEAGNELPDHQRIEFGIGFQAPEEVGEVLYFKVIQTCEEGSVDWITEFDGKGEEPEHPAPAVTVSAATGDAHGDETETTEHGHEEEAATPTTTPAAAATDDDGDSSKGIAVAGLVAGLAGLGLGGASFARSRRG